MIYILLLTAFSLSILLANSIIPRILLVALRKRLFDDDSDKRKSHKGAVPRLGGISFVPTIIFSMSFVLSCLYLLGYEERFLSNTHGLFPQFYMLVCGLTLLFLVGIADDLIGVRYRQKFVVQIIAGIFFPLSGLWINNFYGLLGIYEVSPFFGIPFTIFAVVFITNAINLIDGIDGLASGLSAVVCGVMGCLFTYNEAWLHAILAFSTLGMLLPFFCYNVFGNVKRGRKIFMGDTGSLTLGLVLSFLVVSYSMYDPEIMPFSRGAIVIAFSTLLVPMFDVVRVILVRMRQHKHIFEPDRNHIHHKFLAMGISHRKAMVSIVIMSASFCTLNIIGVEYLNNNIIFFADIIIWIMLNQWFDRIRDSHTKSKKTKKATA